MAVEIRPAVAEELGDFNRVASSALAMSAADFAEMRPEWTLCAFEDGKLATSYAAWPFTMRMNGRAMPVAGVTTVGTDPIYRRRGNLRAIMQHDFARRHEHGEPLAALYASLAAIYQRYGYAIVTTHHRYTVEPRYLQFSFPHDAPGKLREASEDEFGTLVDVYRRFREQRTGSLHRGRGMWQHNAFAAPPPKDGRIARIVYEEGGEALGYAIYATGSGTFPGPGPNHYLHLRDLAWLNTDAYRALWDHLARFDLVREISYPTAPADDPLPHLLLEPRMLNDTASDGILARIIDVDRAFAGRGYDEDGRITFAVEDAMCPWNAGRWELEVSGGTVTVRRSEVAPDFTAPIGTLSMLLFGQLSASDAARMGRLSAERPEALPRADALLRTSHRPFCGDHF